MQSGEDVIADIKEVRASEESVAPLAYQFSQPYSLVIQQPQEKLFEFEGEELEEDEMDLSDVEIKLYPWSPLTVGNSIVSVISVVSLGTPHDNVLDSYQAALKKFQPKDPMSVYIDTEDEEMRQINP